MTLQPTDDLVRQDCPITATPHMWSPLKRYKLYCVNCNLQVHCVDAGVHRDPTQEREALARIVAYYVYGKDKDRVISDLRNIAMKGLGYD